MTRACRDCRFFVADGAICAAPQLIELARLVHGDPRPGTVAPAFLLRLNQATCGTPGYWYVEAPPEPPESKELPALPA